MALDLETFKVELTTPGNAVYGHTEQGAANLVRWLRDRWDYPDEVTRLVSVGTPEDEDWISTKELR